MKMRKIIEFKLIQLNCFRENAVGLSTLSKKTMERAEGDGADHIFLTTLDLVILSFLMRSPR